MRTTIYRTDAATDSVDWSTDMGTGQFPKGTTDDLKDPDPEAARAYITNISSVAADDAKNLILMATLAIGIVLLVVKDSAASVKDLGGPFPALAVAGCAGLLGAAGFLYWYASAVHARRMEIARCLASNDAERARDLWAGEMNGIREQHGWRMTTGIFLMSVGVALSAVVVAALVLS